MTRSRGFARGPAMQWIGPALCVFIIGKSEPTLRYYATPSPAAFSTTAVPGNALGGSDVDTTKTAAAPHPRHRIRKHICRTAG